MTSRLLVLLCLSAASCNSVDVDDVRRHRQSWVDAGIHDYAFVAREGCFCLNRDPDGVRIEVRNDAAVSAIGVSSGVPLADQAQTINDIFDHAIRRAGRDPFQFDVTYDGSLGFIRTLRIDGDLDIADDEYAVDITCFSKDVDDGCPIVTLPEEACTAANGTPSNVAVPDPWETCGSRAAVPIGQITGTDRVCCPGPGAR